jgi:hypothetical protein
MKIQFLKFALGLSLLSVISGCGKSVGHSDVPGTYVAEYPFATETVAVKEGGKFDQTIKVKVNGKVATTNGTWRFDAKDGDIYFSDEFMVVVDGFGEMVTNFDKPTRKAISILPVRCSFGKMQIGVDPRIPYEKMNCTGKEKGGNQ